MAVIPSPYELFLLAAATWRLWRLLALDSILDGPRDRLLDAIDNDKVDELVGCPWCLGAWLALASWTAWWFEPSWTLTLAVPFALSAAIGAAEALHERIADH